MAAKRYVTLTFDNGPTEGVTPLVLDELGMRGIKAWFCLVGNELRSERATEYAVRAKSEGHQIAAHSMLHKVALGDDVSHEHADREIRATHEIICEKLGEPGTCWYRPYGKEGQIGRHLFSDAALSIFAELRYSVLLWNSVPGDWKDPHGWLDKALDDVRHHEHTVVVLHDIPSAALELLPKYLDALEKMDVDVTTKLPESVIPIRHGKATGDLTKLTTVG